LAPNEFWLFPKESLPQRDKYFRILKTSKKCDNGTESYSTAGVPKNVPNSGSIVGLRATQGEYFEGDPPQ
jgi:hypothetical protein